MYLYHNCEMSILEIKQRWYSGECYEKIRCDVESIEKISIDEFYNYVHYECTEMSRDYSGEPIEGSGYLYYCCQIDFDINQKNELYILYDSPSGINFFGGGGKFIQSIHDSVESAKKELGKLNGIEFHSYSIERYVKQKDKFIKGKEEIKPQNVFIEMKEDIEPENKFIEGKAERKIDINQLNKTGKYASSKKNKSTVKKTILFSVIGILAICTATSILKRRHK